MARDDQPHGGNNRLRAARLKQGLRSQNEAAAAISLAGQRVLEDPHFDVAVRTYRKWESNDPGWPRADYQAAIEATFGQPVTRLGFDTPDDYPVDSTEDDVERRSFMSATAAALTAGPIPPRQVDPDLIPYFQQQLEGHYRADMMLGPLDLIGTVSEQYSLIDRLSRNATGDTRRGLLRSGAAYAALVGWLYQDAGDLAAAAFWRGVTGEIAARSRDAQLVGYALVNHASVRTDLGDGVGVTDLCEAALANPRNLAPKVRVMALQQQAHGASLTGDRSSVDKLLAQAGRLINRVDDELPWGNACRRTPGYLEVQRATCYGRLGLHAEAADLWTQVIGPASGVGRRDSGVWLARHATVCARAKAPDQAAEIGARAAQIAVETGSARMRRELGALSSAMRPWQDAPVGRELAQALAPALEGAS
ncbi:Twin-arginine translocation pathway signal [Streptacidiphilus sp. EB129]|uniref:Twin-arginine translocation pathway signal n=1 Tax=Streptacidiphilus sp. EB129 TaxID=3156262 RepID=UPI003514E244